MFSVLKISIFSHSHEEVLTSNEQVMKKSYEQVENKSCASQEQVFKDCDQVVNKS